MLFYFACEAAGALSVRHSLRPLMFQTRKSTGKTRALMRGEIAKTCLTSRSSPRTRGPITTSVSWSKSCQPPCQSARPRSMGSCFRRNDSVVIARSEATKQSIFDLAMPSDGLLRSARNDDDGAHHSLVVPAHAGTHNHKRFLEQKCQPPRQTARPRSMGSCFRRNDSVVIARSEATKQSIFDLAMPSDGLL